LLAIRLRATALQRAAFDAGLRAIELIELREARELVPEPGRPWRDDMFLGLPSGTVYRTVGKGGLARSILLSDDLHKELQTRRLATPVNVTDRGVRRTAVFDIGGGQNLSQSLSDASVRALGFSMGLHGLRHAYAQRRLNTLLAMGVHPLDCLEIVSNCLGHMRTEISLAYTTRRKALANKS
jgi:integrase